MYNLANIQVSPYFEPPPHCLSPQLPGFCRATCGLNFSMFCCKWSQFIWELVKSYLFLWTASPPGTIAEPWHWSRQSQPPWFRGWTLGGGGGSSLRFSGLISTGLNLTLEAGVRVTRIPVFTTLHPQGELRYQCENIQTCGESLFESNRAYSWKQDPKKLLWRTADCSSFYAFEIEEGSKEDYLTAGENKVRTELQDTHNNSVEAWDGAGARWRGALEEN